MSKYSKLYTFGCSFTQNKGQVCWPVPLSEKMNITLENHGVGGESNQHMYHRMVETNIDKDALVIVGLTEMTRVALHSKVVNVVELDINRAMNSYMSTILSIRNFLESENIEYRIFSALNPTPRFLEQMEHAKTFFESRYYDTFNNFLGLPFFPKAGGETLQNFCEQRKMSISNEDFHPTDECHKLWANWLYEKI